MLKQKSKENKQRYAVAKTSVCKMKVLILFVNSLHRSKIILSVAFPKYDVPGNIQKAIVNEDIKPKRNI